MNVNDNIYDIKIESFQNNDTLHQDVLTFFSNEFDNLVLTIWDFKNEEVISKLKKFECTNFFRKVLVSEIEYKVSTENLELVLENILPYLKIKNWGLLNEKSSVLYINWSDQVFIINFFF